MITKVKNGALVTPAGIIEKNLYIKYGKILDITEKELPFDEEIDAEGNYVSAGFIDIHVHGGAGYEFVDGVHLLNPGALSYSRSQVGETYAIININKDNKIEVNFEIV